MKKLFLSISVLLLFGCSNNTISEEQYQALQDQYEKLQQNQEQLKQEQRNTISDLQDKNNQLASELEILKNKPQKSAFELKQECANYEDDILDYMNETWDGGDPQLEEVFYSPSAESCFFVFRYWPYQALGLDCNIDEMGWERYTAYCVLKSKLIVDFLTKEIVANDNKSELRICLEENRECLKEKRESEMFNSILDDLKGKTVSSTTSSSSTNTATRKYDDLEKQVLIERYKELKSEEIARQRGWDIQN